MEASFQLLFGSLISMEKKGGIKNINSEGLFTYKNFLQSSK